MKVVDVKNNFGQLELSNGEHRRVDRLFDILSRDPAPRYSEDQWTSQDKRKDRRDFLEIMHGTFGEFPLQPQICDQYDVVQYFGGQETELGKGQRISVGSSQYIKIGSKSSPARLVLIRTNDQFFGHISFDFSYKFDCEDDVAKLLYARENPSLRGLFGVRHNNSNNLQAYTVDVDRFSLLREVHARAAQIFETPLELIGISRAELNILRRDANTHENLAVRDLSGDRYKLELDRLVNR